jgi:hypothetical protein
LKPDVFVLLVVLPAAEAVMQTSVKAIRLTLTFLII